MIVQGYIDQIRSVVQGMHSTYQELKEQVTVLDRRVSQLYHDIERTPLDEGGIELYGELQSVLKERRNAKFDLQNLYNLISTLETKEIRKKLNQVESVLSYQKESLNKWKNKSNELAAPGDVSIAQAIIDAVKESEQ